MNKHVVSTLALMVAACGGSKTGASTGPTPTAAAPTLRLPQLADPGATLLAREQSIWLLEGRLLADADAALRAADAATALGTPAARAATAAEGRIRAYVRAHRSAEAKARAQDIVASLSVPTRELLDRAARPQHLTAEDIFLDYLTYEGLYDLATMRYGWQRLHAGAYAEGTPARKLADGFFALATTEPSLRDGISVVSSDATSLQVSVFGATVRDDVSASKVVAAAGVGRVGKVAWSSTYEQLRAAARGAAAVDTIDEQLDTEDGKYLITYAVEVDEYLAWGAQQPWATILSLMPVDEAADLYAGVAAAGGLEAGAGAPDPATLPRTGVVGDGKHGLTVTVVDARAAATVAGNKPRRGRFLIVTVELASALASELRAPASWFALAAHDAVFPEIGVTRPGWGPAILATGPSGARLAALPYSAVPAKGHLKLSLVYDVPSDLTTAALLVGADQLALKVEVK